jgi:hypothetical protein
MSLGTSIFLSSLLLGLIYLYIKTKNDWNWKKIFIIIAGIAILLVAVFLITVFWDKVFTKSDYFYARKDYSGIINSYQGVSIGDKLSDVQFKFGKLEEIDSTKKDDDTRIYWIEKKFLIFVSNKSNKVDFIVALCEKGILEKFNGIECNDTGEKLEKTFGKNLIIQCNTSKDSSNRFTRVYAVPKYATRYYLEKNKVESIMFYGEEYKSTNWGECK